jgi:hypothetical protein
MEHHIAKTERLHGGRERPLFHLIHVKVAIDGTLRTFANCLCSPVLAAHRVVQRYRIHYS